MRYYYICDDCLKLAAETDIENLSVEEYHYLCAILAFESSRTPDDKTRVLCNICQGTNTRKLLTPPTSYIKGYGYLDKNGTTNDRDLYLMTEGQDPYASSRKLGDKKEIIRKLRKNKEFNPKTRAVNMSTKKIFKKT